MDNFLKKVDFFLLWMYSTPPQAQRCITDTVFSSENKCSPVSYVSTMSAPCPYGSYFCSVFQTYVFLCIAELHSGWCDGTSCKAFIGAYDMFIMSLTPREIYWVSRMTCYLFKNFSFARFACHCACCSTVYRCVWMCLCERDRGSKIKGSWQHFYKFRKRLHSLKPMNTETEGPDMSYES